MNFFLHLVLYIVFFLDIYVHAKLLDFKSSLFMFYTKSFCFGAICFVTGLELAQN